MHNYPLNLIFKGERDYLQGGDLYTIVQKNAANIFGTKAWINHIVFRGFARNACELILGEIKDVVDMESVRAKCTVQHDGQIVNGIIIETKNPITDKYPFDEGQVAKAAVLEGQSIRQKNRAGFSAIEEIIVLTKILHNQLIPVQPRRWIFSQLDLTEPFATEQQCLYTIKLKQNLAGRMTVSQILQDAKIIGTIRFTAILK